VMVVVVVVVVELGLSAIQSCGVTDEPRLLVPSLKVLFLMISTL
jgi:hypothetical protein